MSEYQTAPRSRFFTLPTTLFGRVAGWVFVLGIALSMLVSTVFEDEAFAAGDLNVIGMATFLVMLVTLVCGGIALVRDRERSWAVWLVTVLTGVVLAFEVVTLLFALE